ncbi:CYIR protein [Plasmodium cynomolgi strain B]|uniref:CYIR protein n=1 Tax=Plasmodium cynomolgi (strain B) TaxID=1120755 RepID=K6V0U4_PLACD|nr:CYIR protein [Plasmodium cynomolgi strain B]GAB69959.1 CYIR protein [Plasmodium cynomolgi strain B]
MTPKPDDMNSIHPIFEKLATFFTGDHAYTYIGEVPSCIYVNYWLNNKLRDLYFFDRKYEFNVFKDFSNQFSKARDGVLNSCNSNMKYYDNDKWNRIKFLYELYDIFEEIISLNKDNTVLQCDKIILLRILFNKFINNYDGKDYELMVKLIKFKELLLKKVLEFNGYCKNEINNFQSPLKYLQKKEQESEEAARTQAKIERTQQRQVVEQEQAKQQAEISLSGVEILGGIATVKEQKENLKIVVENNVNHTDDSSLEISRGNVFIKYYQLLIIFIILKYNKNETIISLNMNIYSINSLLLSVPG